MCIKHGLFVNQGTASWKEMVEDAVGNDQALQLSFIRMLINAKDSSEGLYWAKKFNIPKEQWPWALLYEEEQSENQGTFITYCTFLPGSIS